MKHRYPRLRLGLLSFMLLLPLVVVAHLPIAAALIPSAILTVAALGDGGSEESKPPVEVVLAHDSEMLRVSRATPVQGSSRRVG